MTHTWGISYSSQNNSAPNYRDTITTIEAAWGNQFNLIRDYYSLTDSPKINSTDLAFHNRGSELVLSYKCKNNSGPISYASFSNGSNDSDIQAIADAVCALTFGGGKASTIYICFQHECDAAAAKGSGSNPADFITAHKHFWDIFTARCTTNGKPSNFVGTTVQRVWIVTGYGYVSYTGRANALWPGSSYVDVIGSDPYNFSDKANDNTTASNNAGAYPGFTFNTNGWVDSADPNSQVVATVNWRNTSINPTGAALSQPIIFTEFNSAEDVTIPAYATGGVRPDWNWNSTLAAHSPALTNRKATWIQNYDNYRVQHSEIIGTCIYNDSPELGREYFRISSLNPWSTTYNKWKSVVTANTQGGGSAPLNPPTPGTTTSITSTSATLNWTAPTTRTDGTTATPSGYYIYQDGSATHYAKAVAASATSFNLTGFQANTTHVFNITAFDSNAVESAKSTNITVVFSNTTGTAPTAPVISTITSPSSGQVNLTWTTGAANGGATIAGYIVNRGGTAITGTLSASTLSYADTGVAPNTAYTYSVTIVDSNGLVSTSSTQNITTGPDTTKPTAPVVSVNPSSTSASVNWTASTDNVGVTAYNVYFAIASQPLVKIASLSPTTFAYNLSSLQSSQNYVVAVTAIDLAGNESIISQSTSNFTTTGPVVPTVTGITVTSIAGDSHNYSVNIQATGSNLRYAILSFGDGTTTATSSSSAFPHNFAQYGYYKVSAAVTDTVAMVTSVVFTTTVYIPDPNGLYTSRGYRLPQYGEPISAKLFQGIIGSINDDVNNVANTISYGQAYFGAFIRTGYTESMPRALLANTGPSLTAGYLKIKFFYAQNALSLINLSSSIMTAIIAGDSTTLFRMGVFSYNPTTDTATVLATTGNNTSVPSSAADFTMPLTTFQSGQTTCTVAAGTYVGFGAIWVGSLGAGHNPPTILGAGGVGGQEFNKTPRIAGYVTSLSDIPSVGTAINSWATTNPPSSLYILGS